MYKRKGTSYLKEKTRAAVCQLIKDKYGITITLRNMSEYLKYWGMTCRFMCYEESMTQQLFIVDNLKVHHGKIVKEWLGHYRDEIEVFFISSYSPEINPDEYLNHNLKQNVHTGIIPHTKEQIQKKTETFMKVLQENKEKVTSLFQHRKLNYIAGYGC